MRKFFPAVFALSLMAILASPGAQAAVQLSNTRVVMKEQDQHAAIYATNLTNYPYVVQTWIEGPDGSMETPFFVTPPLSRMDGGAERGLSITKVGEGLPEDRESYFWFNLLEVPQKGAGDDNSLSIATRTRIKFFYRPTAMQGGVRGPQQLEWALVRPASGACELSIRNTSPYIVNFSRIGVSGETEEFGRGAMAMPFDTMRLPLGSCPADTAGLNVVPHVINDYGAVNAWPNPKIGAAASAADSAGH
ncbi:molecular chaperone [Kerstersia gyiorum]|uniref:fimbrial biogenesis chaperone n=1 Tax=Kerstersia gyiorum TaxID=206506 RepID=UPI0020A1BBC3|nr:molecular chaperone [Kerstersia gyiorum]MCP1634243.1 P pilus assembly chaperone PapD [Kerstersia gyiorum]MCP1638161.1 P pilus assembly chaperone PapD [Kerstersia gyiorum]MCP1672751.1 P pilus assembly chaperone PapD [Kerstersia gyiorum]MCP1680045.1 P pilus assembly chaperone PapD [Kerstersia gyiorum]MCP1683605.1 P pilus assembly chaperone PapD [Kerstersia gyiorum]